MTNWTHILVKPSQLLHNSHLVSHWLNHGPTAATQHLSWMTYRQCSGSGSISQRYGSGSFYHQAKIVRKTLIPTILWLFLTFYLWKMMSLYLQKVISRQLSKKLFLIGILKVNDENSRIRIHQSEAWIRGSGAGSTPKCHGSATLPTGRTYLWNHPSSCITVFLSLIGWLIDKRQQNDADSQWCQKCFQNRKFQYLEDF